MNDVKVKLDNVHKLLKKHVSFVEDVHAVDVDSDRDNEEDVNFITSTSFQNQRFRNQGDNIKFYGNEHKSKYNKCSQYQKSYNNT